MNDYPERAFVRERDTETVYQKRSGVWWAFSTPTACGAALASAGKAWADIETVERGSVAGLRELPPPLTFFQDGQTGAMFVVIAGARFRAQTRDREALGGKYEDVVGVPPDTYGWIPYGGHYRRWLGVPLTSRFVRELVFLHRPWPQQFVWLAIGGLIGGMLSPLGTWLVGLLH